HPARGLFLRHLRSSGYLSAVGYFRWMLALARSTWQARVAVAEPPGSRPEASGTLPQPRYRVLGTTGISVGRRYIWLHGARSDVARVVPVRTAQLLFSCDYFATLEEHAYRIAKTETRSGLTRISVGMRLRSRASRFVARLLAGHFDA